MVILDKLMYTVLRTLDMEIYCTYMPMSMKLFFSMVEEVRLVWIPTTAA